MTVSLPLRGTPVSPSLDLPDQLLALRRRWRLILAFSGFTLAVALTGLSFAKTSYTATGVLLYDPGNAVTPGDPLAPVEDQENEDAATTSQTAVIASLPVARAMATAMNLAASPRFNPGLRRRPWPFNLLKKPGAAGPDDVARNVRDALSVTVAPGSRVLAVSFSSADPEQAAAGANLAMQFYLTHQRDQAFAVLGAAQGWLETNADRQQTSLDATEAALAKARAAAGIVPGAQASLTAETASRLAASLVAAQADLAMIKARLAAVPAGDAAAANAAIAPNLLPLRKEQADLSAQVQALRQQYGPDYPNLVAARSSLEAITAEINAETQRELDAARADMAADQAQIITLDTALQAARDESQMEDAESAPMRALEQRADAGRAMLRSMTLRADQLAQEASLIKPDAKILSAASPPVSPSGPHRSLIAAAAAALGLCGGLLLAGLAEALDTSIRSGDVLRAVSGLHCLALVPEIKDPKAAALAAPFSMFSEQLRALRTALKLGMPGGANQVLAITAARPAEGKTTLTIALARALAESGLAVVAVDGDIRQPSFDPVFDLAGTVGLTDYLAGRASLEDILQHDPHSALAVIGAGTPGPGALSLFLSPAMPALIDKLRSRYDVVLLDVPPAFALAEGRVLAGLADSALLCVRWGHTPRRVVAAAMTLLEEAGVNLAGAALTRVDVLAHGRSGFADAEVYQPRYGGYFR